MTLILLLLVLVTERVALQGTKWHVAPYLTWYVDKLLPKFFKKDTESLAILLFVAIPAVSIGLLLYFIDIGLIEFAANLVVLAVIIGNTEVRAFYRQYLNAENRNDVEAMNLLQSELSEQGFATEKQISSNTETTDAAEDVSEQIVAESEATDASEEAIDIVPEPKPLSESLIWCNFKYYAAPIFYYVIFGLPGIVFYATVLYLFESASLKNRLPDNVVSTLKTWNEWMFWLPARFVSVGFMFVGHFSNGLEAYLKLAADFSVPAYQMITKVAHAAEGGNPDANEKNMVKLAKRNMALFVVVVALLTLYGYIV